VLSLLLAGCATEPLHSIADDTGTPPPPCGITVDATLPAAGADAAYVRGPIEFHLSDADPNAQVVADFPGQQTLRDDGRTVVFTPDAPLRPETAYTVGLDYCGGHPSIDFTTSALGEPLDPGVDLVGRTFALDLADARFLAGPGLEDVVATYLSPQILVSVVDENAAGLHLRVALPLPNDLQAQDPCARTVDLPSAAFDEAPFFVVQGTDLDFGTGDQTVNLRSLSITGTMAPDGTWMGGGTFDALLDARDLATLLASTPDDLCSVAEGLGVPCAPCPQDDAPYCVDVQADHLTADWLPDTPVTDVPSTPGACR